MTIQEIIRWANLCHKQASQSKDGFCLANWWSQIQIDNMAWGWNLYQGSANGFQTCFSSIITSPMFVPAWQFHPPFAGLELCWRISATQLKWQYSCPLQKHTPKMRLQRELYNITLKQRTVVSVPPKPKLTWQESVVITL